MITWLRAGMRTTKDEVIKRDWSLKTDEPLAVVETPPS
jgi:hypothetical protein